MNRYFAVGYRHYRHHRCCCLRRRRRNTGTCNYQGVIDTFAVETYSKNAKAFIPPADAAMTQNVSIVKP
jgi:hypothetical protein